MTPFRSQSSLLTLSCFDISNELVECYNCVNIIYILIFDFCYLIDIKDEDNWRVYC